jgi:hypothetical protein
MNIKRHFSSQERGFFIFVRIVFLRSHFSPPSTHHMMNVEHHVTSTSTITPRPPPHTTTINDNDNDAPHSLLSLPTTPYRQRRLPRQQTQHRQHHLWPQMSHLVHNAAQTTRIVVWAIVSFFFFYHSCSLY